MTDEASRLQNGRGHPRFWIYYEPAPVQPRPALLQKRRVGGHKTLFRRSLALRDRLVLNTPRGPMLLTHSATIGSPTGQPPGAHWREAGDVNPRMLRRASGEPLCLEPE